MLMTVGFPPGEINGERTPEYVQVLKEYQSANGLPSSGSAEQPTRARLFKAYMDCVCCDPEGKPFKLNKTDFLARGADAAGKGDYQGCGEFCPLLMFSAEEDKAYKDPSLKEQRDLDNAPNRRVVAFLFRPHSRVLPEKFPCPRAGEGPQKCHKRFWSDASRRRTFQEKRREFAEDKDTFACRFYERIASDSPCEGILRPFRIRLLDPFAKPISYAPFRITAEGCGEIRSKADGDGWATARGLKVPKAAKIEWGYPPAYSQGQEESAKNEPPQLVYSMDIIFDIDDTKEEKAAEQRLDNLGYSGEDLSSKIIAFQRAYGLPQTGVLADVKEDLWKYHDTANPEPLPDSNDSVDLDEFHE
jgi:hypothetical protein